MRLGTVTIACCFLILSGMTSCKQNDWSTRVLNKEHVPLDTGLVRGRLSNGFSYYIKNANVESAIEIRFLVKVGSNDDTSLEMSHVIEHLAFEGSVDYPGDSAVRYLRSKGMVFGIDVNAYTDKTNTGYKFTIPNDCVEIIPVVFNIIRNIACNLTFNEERVASQKSTVVEEIRTGLFASLRAKQNVEIWGNYGHGSSYLQEVEASFEKVGRDSVVSFYNRWYRPEFEALVIIGNVNVALIEKQIGAIFTGIKKPADLDVNRSFNVVERFLNRELRIMSFKTELNEPSTITIYCKRRSLPSKLVKFRDYRNFVKRELLSYLITDHFNYLPTKSDSLLGEGAIEYDYLGSGVDAIFLQMGNIDAGNIVDGFKRLVVELRRLELHGFSEREFDRAKFFCKRQAGMKAKSDLLDKCKDNFILGIPIRDSRAEEHIMNVYCDEIQLKELNSDIKRWIDFRRNMDIVFLGDSSNQLFGLSKQMVKYWIDQAFIESRRPLKETFDDMANRSLMEGVEMPDSIGTIFDVTKCERDSTLDVIHLCNGAKVILVPNKEYADPGAVGIFGWSPGGTSVYQGINKIVAGDVSMISSRSGAGRFNGRQLADLLLKKNISFRSLIESNFDRMVGEAKKGDLEYLLQLIYLHFNFFRIDTAVVEDWKRFNVMSIRKTAANPVLHFRNFAYNFVDNRKVVECSDIERINMDDIRGIYSDRFSGVSDFTFVIVGDFNYDDSLTTLIRRYLGNITAGYKDQIPIIGDSFYTGKVDTLLYGGSLDVADVTLFFLSGDHMIYSVRNILLLKVVCKILEYSLFTRLRSDEGGVYYPSVILNILRKSFDSMTYRIAVQFSCKPGSQNHLISCVEDEVSNISIREMPIDIIESALLEVKPTLRIDGAFWDVVFDSCINDYIPISQLEYINVLRDISQSDVVDVLRDLTNLKRQRFLMLPK